MSSLATMPVSKKPSPNSLGTAPVARGKMLTLEQYLAWLETKEGVEVRL